MTPKEKAKQLIDKFAMVNASFSEIGGGHSDIDIGKPSALICVNEIIELQTDQADWTLSYWEEVKTEIQ